MKICVHCFDQYPDDISVCTKDGRALMQLGDTTRLPLIGSIAAGRFLILDIIASGGMGTIYRAHQLSMGRQVALKLLQGNDLKDPEFVERFIREARATAQLRSPHTIVLHDFGQCDDSSMFIAMELLSGKSLDNLIRDTPLHAARARRLMIQVCLSLEEAHQRGLVHRDIKPSNIMIENEGTPDEFVKVLDFGLVKVSESLTPDQMALTRPGTIHGTPPYMAPEMWAEGTPVGPPVDTYAVGATLYEMLAGKRAFMAKSIPALLHKHMHDPPPHLEHPGLAPFDAIIQRCLAKKPEDRYESIKAVRLDLMRLTADDAQSLPPGQQTDLLHGGTDKLSGSNPSNPQGTWRMDGPAPAASTKHIPQTEADLIPNTAQLPPPEATRPMRGTGDLPMPTAVATEPSYRDGPPRPHPSEPRGLEVIDRPSPKPMWTLVGAAAVLISAIAFAVIITTKEPDPTTNPTNAIVDPTATSSVTVVKMAPPPPPPPPPPVVVKNDPPPPPPPPPPPHVEKKRARLAMVKSVVLDQSNASGLVGNLDKETARCVKEALGGHAQNLRVNVIVKPDGSLSALRVMPESAEAKRFGDCLWSKVSSLKVTAFEGAGFGMVTAELQP